MPENGLHTCHGHGPWAAQLPRKATQRAVLPRQVVRLQGRSSRSGSCGPMLWRIYKSTLYIAAFMTKCTCTCIQAVQKVDFVMKWRCYNRYCGLKLNEICHHQMRFIGSSFLLRPKSVCGWGSAPRTPLGELTALPQTL